MAKICDACHATIYGNEVHRKIEGNLKYWHPDCYPYSQAEIDGQDKDNASPTS